MLTHMLTHINNFRLTWPALLRASVSLPSGSTKTIAGGVMAAESVAAVAAFVHAVGTPFPTRTLLTARGSRVARGTQTRAANGVAVAVGTLGARKSARSPVRSLTKKLGVERYVIIEKPAFLDILDYPF